MRHSYQGYGRNKMMGLGFLELLILAVIAFVVIIGIVAVIFLVKKSG